MGAWAKWGGRLSTPGESLTTLAALPFAERLAELRRRRALETAGLPAAALDAPTSIGAFIGFHLAARAEGKGRRKPSRPRGTADDQQRVGGGAGEGARNVLPCSRAAGAVGTALPRRGGSRCALGAGRSARTDGRPQARSGLPLLGERSRHGPAVRRGALLRGRRRLDVYRLLRAPRAAAGSLSGYGHLRRMGRSHAGVLGIRSPPDKRTDARL
jgi:hypothetical protein